jgi:peptide/nickel transport system substrate-binding protein
MSKNRIVCLVGILLLAMGLVACQPEAEIVEVTRVITDTETVEIVVTQIVTEIEEIEGEDVEVTRVVEVVVEPTDVPPPTGGFLVESSFADWNQLNPILSADSASSDVNTKMYLSLLTLHEFSGEVVGEIATDWTVSEDGLIYTFNLRDDILWSDETPLTANDVKFTYDAIAHESVDTPRKSNVELIESITAVDDYTLEMVFSSVDCTALQNLTLGVLPAHAFDNDPTTVMDSPENLAPTVVSGPFMFQEHEADSFTTLVSNPNYYLGAPNVDGWTYRVFADQSAELAATLAGEVDVTGVGPQFVSVIEGEIASGAPLQMKKFFDDGYTYVGFNLADPTNPQFGFEDANENGIWDEGEAFIDNDPHPIFSDFAVRSAIGQAIDYTNVINRVLFGQGVQAISNVLPAVEWAYNTELESPVFDLEAAAATLEEAGWVDSDGDGIRERDGMDLAFTLMTNAGNEVRENIAAIMDDTLSQIGFDVSLEIIEFGTVVGNLLGQTYDAVIIGWTGLGSDPEDSVFWHPRNDTPGSGFNFISYNNPQVTEMLDEARGLPGCDTAERGVLYKEMQEIILADQGYAFLYVPLGNVVYHQRVGGIDPGPWATYYNVEDWFISAE